MNGMARDFGTKNLIDRPPIQPGERAPDFALPALQEERHRVPRDETLTAL